MRFLFVFFCLAVGVWAQGERKHRVLEIDPRVEARVLREAGIEKLEALGGRAWLVAMTPGSAYWGKSEVLTLKQKLGEELQEGRRPAWAVVRLRGGVEGLELNVTYHKDVSADQAQGELDSHGYEIVHRSDYFERLTVRIPAEDLPRLAAEDWVRRIEAGFPPVVFASNADSGRQLKADVLHNDLALTGGGATVAVIDSQVDLHPEFGDRLRRTRPGTADFHGTHVAGTVAAAGNNPDLKGIAPAAKLVTTSFRTIPEGVEAIRNAKALEGADLATNSWTAVASEAVGTCNLMGTYTTFDRDVDRVVVAERLPVIFAMGNTRDQYDCAMFARAGFYTAPPPNSAKNVISVGAIDRAGATSTFSAFGPVKDGRVKPELVARGVGVLSTGLNGATRTLSGTSMATPAVAGLAALLVDRFRQRNGAAPEPDLLKAILVNTANDLGNPGPDYSYGYGIPDGVKAVEVIDKNQLWRESIASGAAREFDVEVPAGATSLRVALAWMDPPGPAGAERVLIHDLDLVLVAPDGTRTLPLTLNPLRPEADAAPAENLRDNLEQVVVRTPAAGTWKVRVQAKELSFGTQMFSLVWTTAENPAPPCTTTVFPTSANFPETEATFVFQVARSSTCEAWGLTEAPEWVRASEPSSTRASGLVKIQVANNNSGAQRSAAIRVAGVPVTIRQNTQCVAAPITPGELTIGRLADTDCSYPNLPNYYAKLYTFSAKAGQRVVVSANSASIDAYILLVGPGGIYIDEDDDSGGGLNSRIPPAGSLALPIDGTYSLYVSSAFPRETGSFTVRVDLSDATGGAGALPRIIEACPVSREGVLTNEASVEGRRGDLYRTDVYLFEGRVGQTLRASVPTAAFDAVAYLLAPSGAQLAFSDDTAAGNGPVIERVLTANGVYRLEITSFSPFQLGAYTLSVEGCANWPQR